jgi:hypothetical protein
LSLILHPANSFKKGKVPIVKQMLPVMVRSVYATKYSVEHLRHFKHKTIAKFLLETIPLKNRRSIRILRAHAWKKKLHFEPSKYSMELKYSLEVTPQPQVSFTKLHGQWPIANGKKGTSFRESAPFPAWKHLEADPWGATSRRHTGKHSDGWCAQPLA